MATVNKYNGFSGDWMEYIDHIDGMAFGSGTATTVNYSINSLEDDPAVAGLDGGRLALSGSGFVVSGANASGGTISSISFYSGLAGSPLLFEISGLALKLDTFKTIAAGGDLDEFLALATDYVGHDHGDDHGDDNNESDDEDADDSISDDSDDYYEDNGSLTDNRHGGSGDDDYFGGGGNDTLAGGAGSDDLYGESGSDDLRGEDDSDELYGGGGSDDLYGGNGLDWLYGGSGNDLIDGGSGDDRLFGGSGDDVYRVNSSGDRVYETVTSNSGSGNAGGIDTVSCSVSFSLSAYAGVSYVENLRLSSASAINGTGNSLNNTIYAGAGNNTIDGLSGVDTASYTYAQSAVTVDLSITVAQDTGGSGRDILKHVERLSGSNYGDDLFGNSGNNVLSGQSGADDLRGGGGNDLLRGGKGDDMLRGGSGADDFRFDTALSTVSVRNLDRIVDFSVADDTLQLDNAIFKKLGAGMLSAGQFKTAGSSSGSSSDDYIIYNKATGGLFYDADGGADGTSDAIRFATVGVNLNLTHADFEVI